MSEDWLGLDDLDERRQKRPPAFITSAPMGLEEMKVAERMHLDSIRDARFVGATEIVFTILSDDGAEEMLPPDQAQKFQALMGWPVGSRYPTIDEITQFQKARDAALHREHWGALQAAVLRDAEDTAAAEQVRNDLTTAKFRK